MHTYIIKNIQIYTNKEIKTYHIKSTFINFKEIYKY